MTISSSTTARFDTVEHHPDEAVTAYAYFPPIEATLRDLAQDLFGTYWRSVVLGALDCRAAARDG